jgi:hypothetical protein
MWISFRATVGKAASETGGLSRVTRISLSPRVAWKFIVSARAQAPNVPTNTKSTTFMEVRNMEAITVGALWWLREHGINAQNHHISIMIHFMIVGQQFISLLRPSHQPASSRWLCLTRILFPNAEGERRRAEVKDQGTPQ